MLGMSPARRQFHPGGKIEYLCLLQKAPARLDARIRILRGDKEIFSAPAEVVEVNGSRVVTGLFRLTDAIRPGEYHIGVVTSEAEKKNPAMDGQWTDFEVVPN